MSKGLKMRGKLVYHIEIIETSAKTIMVTAKTEEEAFEIARNMYIEGEIVLDSNDFCDYEINMI